MMLKLLKSGLNLSQNLLQRVILRLFNPKYFRLKTSTGLNTQVLREVLLTGLAIRFAEGEFLKPPKSITVSMMTKRPYFGLRAQLSPFGKLFLRSSEGSIRSLNFTWKRLTSAGEH